jgi:hypothetical protein
MILGQSTIIMGDDTPSYKCIAISRETPILKKAYKKLTSSVTAYDEHDCEEFLYVEFKDVKRKRRLAVELNTPKSQEEQDAAKLKREKATSKLAKDEARARAEAEKVEKARFEASPAGKKLAEARRAANQVVQRRNARIARICKA